MFYYSAEWAKQWPFGRMVLASPLGKPRIAEVAILTKVKVEMKELMNYLTELEFLYSKRISKIWLD